MSTGFIEARAEVARPAGHEPARAGGGERPVFSPQLIGFMGALCLAALVIATFGRMTGIGVQKLPQAADAETRDLRFLDAGGGAIEVRNAADDALVRRLAPGEGGFVRTVMRGMAQSRLARGGDSVTPFRLALRTDGRLIIRDPVTGREVILDSFGKPNRDGFAALLSGGALAAQPAGSPAAGAVQPQGNKK